MSEYEDDRELGETVSSPEAPNFSPGDSCPICGERLRGDAENSPACAVNYCVWEVANASG